MVAVLLVVIVTGVTVASAGVIAAGGVAGVTVATLDQGLPDVRAFQDLGFAEPTIVYDRKGKTELARFWDVRRKVVKFEDIPPLVLDVTTAVEDDTFWDNPGFDLEATLNAFVQDTAGSSDRGGGSTITQQLVRARLLPKDVIANDNTTEGLYVRKAKELIQSYKLTQAYPGEEGKKAIITAYLNEISYYRANGIAAAADVVFGKRLDELSVSEAALLAAIPQSPSLFDPYKHAKRQAYGKKPKKGKRKTHLVIPTCGADPAADCKDNALIVRRNFILRRLKDGNGRWTTLSDEQYREALNEEPVIKRIKPTRYKAPHFVNALVRELDLILADREPKERGGYTVITTLDMKAQKLGEKFIAAGAYLPTLPPAKYQKALNRYKLRRDSGWISNLRGTNLRNGALVAMDYRTGDLLAYVGSAGYYRKKSPKFAPKVDHVAGSHRQMGSAWKPMVYATGIDTYALTAGSYLLDKREQFGPGWTPQNADRVYRGYIRVRDALQQSLNIPAIRALQKTGITTVRKYVVNAGFSFLYGNNKALDQAGLAGALGTVEVRPIDMTAAFGAFGNGGKVTRPRHILKVIGPNDEVIYEAGDPITTQVWKPSTAYIMADILEGNSNRAENPIWGPVFESHNTKNGARRPAAVKTGTTNQLKDYSTYGILPMPKNKKAPALAVGVWYGNSNSASPNLGLLRYSLDNAGETWAAFVREYMKNKPVANFQRPKSGVVAASMGGRTELFVKGTQPGGPRQVDSTTSIPSGGGTTTTTPSTGSSGGGGGGGGGRGGGGNNNGGGGGGGGGGGPAPAPTCRPGFTDRPTGCVITAPG